MHHQTAAPAYGAHQTAQPRVLSIEGSHLAGVEFFGERDGTILLQFPEGRLEVIAAARLILGKEETDARSEKARLALRSHISKVVAKVALDVGGQLEIDFEDGARLVVALDGAHAEGGEAAAFFDENWVYESY